MLHAKAVMKMRRAGECILLNFVFVILQMFEIYFLKVLVFEEVLILERA
jgi:hypothetical protein